MLYQKRNITQYNQQTPFWLFGILSVYNIALGMTNAYFCRWALDTLLEISYTLSLIEKMWWIAQFRQVISDPQIKCPKAIWNGLPS